MADYIIRDIPDDIWRTVKSNAALEGFTIKDIIQNLIAGYAQKTPGKTASAKKK